MKILQINKYYHPVIGGIETAVKNIADLLDGVEGLEIDILACNDGSKRVISQDRPRVHKASSLGKALGMPLSLDFFRLFFQLNNKYDLVLLHHPFPLSLLLVPFIKEKRLAIFYHSDIIRQKVGGFLFSPLIRLALRKASLVIVGSNNLISSSPFLSKIRDKCQVIPFGMRAEYSNEDKEEAERIRRDYGNKPVLLAVGRLVYYKGFEYAVRAMKDIPARLIIIGKGPEKEKLVIISKELGLQDKVAILDPQNNLAPYFLACDIFLFPSTERSEAFGLVQVEALAAGKPIINTYLQTGVEEVSINGVTGFTVPPRDEKAIASAANKILGDQRLKEEYSQNAKERYLNHYTLDTFREKLISILKKRS